MYMEIYITSMPASENILTNIIIHAFIQLTTNWM